MQTEAEPFVFEAYIDGTRTTVTLNPGQSVKYTWSHNSSFLIERGVVTFYLRKGKVHRLYQSTTIYHDHFVTYEIAGACPIQVLRDTDPFFKEWEVSHSITKVFGDFEDAIPI